MLKEPKLFLSRYSACGISGALFSFWRLPSVLLVSCLDVARNGLAAERLGPLVDSLCLTSHQACNERRHLLRAHVLKSDVSALTVSA